MNHLVLARKVNVVEVVYKFVKKIKFHVSVEHKKNYVKNKNLLDTYEWISSFTNHL